MCSILTRYLCCLFFFFLPCAVSFLMSVGSPTIAELPSVTGKLGHGKLGHYPISDIKRSKSLLYRRAQQQDFPEAFKAAKKLTPLRRGHPLHHFRVKLSDAGHLIAVSRVRNPDAPNQPEELVVLSTKWKSPDCYFSHSIAPTVIQVHQHCCPSSQLPMRSSVFVKSSV